jgi:DNA-binding response OmpR family regulator
MPDQDGFETLAHIKARDGLRHLPVIIISAIDEMDSVICCMKMGATDYLPRPFDGALLQARISASLASKRLRDLELEYLEQVECVTAAAADLENGQFEIADLDPVAARDDALGQLARVFQRMAREVRARQDCLERDARALRIEIDHVRQAEKVVEITETEYYQHLRAQAEDLRRILAG